MTCDTAFLYTRRTAAKYPQNAEQSESGRSESDTPRSDNAARGSCRKCTAQGFAKKKSPTVAAVPNAAAYRRQLRIALLALFPSPRPTCRATSRVAARLTPEVAKVTAKV